MAEQARIDFAALNAALLGSAEHWVALWLPGGKRRGREWVCGDLSGCEGTSCSVNLKTGFWADFQSGDRGGDLISLYAAIHRMNQGAAARELQQLLGTAPAPARQAPQREPQLKKPEVEWLPICPVPADAPDFQTQWGHYARGVPKMHWPYRNQAGDLLGVVCRFEASDGSKDVQPLSYCQGSNGRREWRYKAFVEPRPLYGLERLRGLDDGLEKPLVVVVEGEKCADALYEALGQQTPVLAWPGGAKAVQKADWSVLKGCRVLCWPDADAKADKGTGLMLPIEDQPGVMAMRMVERLLKPLGTQVRLVDIGAPGEHADGWDCFDAIAEGYARDDLLAFMRKILPQAPVDAPAPAPARGGSTPSRACAGQEEAADEWRARLIMRNKVELLACVPNVIEVMQHHEAWQGVAGYDEFAQRVVKRRPAPFDRPGTVLQSDEWSDVDDTRAAAWIAQNEKFVPHSANVAEAVNVVARLNGFHPVLDWLRTLRWDGVPRLDLWMSDFLAVRDSEYVRRVSRYFLIGMCMRVLHPGVKFDYCLVLEGKQGKRKSTALRVLGGEWFSDIELDLSNKDSMSNIRGKWLHEFGEMGSIARAESTRQKSFLSRQVDEFRPSYGRREIRCPRQSAFAGTTNEWAWNKDPTGGRRFWPVVVEDEINTDGLGMVREQLFAEAFQAAVAGERYWPDAQEQRDLFDDEQLARESPEAFVELLAAWMADQRSDIGETFTMTDAIMSGLRLDAKSITRDIQTRVGFALSKLGCGRVEKRTGPVRFVYKRPQRNAALSRSEARDPADEEVPF